MTGLTDAVEGEMGMALFRNRMPRVTLMAGALAVMATLSGCEQLAGGTARPALGTLGGAAAGGALGSLVGSGSGRTAAIVGGALLGGIAGNQLVDRPVEQRQIAEHEAARDREMQRRLDFDRMSALQQEQVQREIREQRLYEEWRSQRVGGAPLTGTDQVAEAQRLLTAHGLYRGPISGANGPQTQAAVRTFQRSQGLPETGLLTASLVSFMRATL
jgi:hypothetical protein